MADEHESDRDVLNSLPRTRPARRSARRGEPGAAKPTAAKAKAKAPANKASAKAKPKAAAAKKQAAPKQAAAAKPKAQRPVTPPPPPRKIPPAGSAPPRGHGADDGPPNPAEIVTTAVQAAGELAQIGLTVSKQALRSALDRLPKP